jgi:hypothetical protein
VRRALVLALFSALVLAGTSAAAVAPLFDQATAHPGERVTIEAGYVGNRPGQVIVYLIRLGDVPRLFHVPYIGLPVPQPGPPPTDPRLHRLGPMRTNGHGGGKLELTVPSPAPARYTLVVWGKTCVRPNGDHWYMAAPNFILNPKAILRVVRKRRP